MENSETFEAAVQRHDQSVAALGLALWVGSEPTFTDRQDHAPHWLSTALGGDKLLRAQALMRDLSQRAPGGLVLRSVGRQYPGEKQPRWNLGLLPTRDGSALWPGPPDPMLLNPTCAATFDLPQWTAALARAFSAQGWETVVSEPSVKESTWVIHTTSEDGTHLQFGLWADTAAFDPTLETYTPEPIAGAVPTPEHDSSAPSYPGLTLPVIDQVTQLRCVLQCVARAAADCALPALVWRGAPPPVDQTLALTTLTPDPAVIEVNCAPSASASEFLQRSQVVYAGAQMQGLSPYRLYFNGLVADSGGAGQITLGGSSPQGSPFLQHPALLPRLVTFMNRHPCLSYLFAHDHVGSSGQSVRTDERGSDAFDDLQLALILLARKSHTEPELLWRSLAPFLCDASGNSHRAETNIEKLWNPHLPGRGCLGLVEFRALRMQHTPERATAIACLLRAVVALQLHLTEPLPLIDWGRDLHDRFALPFYLEQDLLKVLTQLDQAGLGLGQTIRRELLRDEFRLFGQWEIAGGQLTLRRAIEFWPLLGDAASPEQLGTSRLVDASTARIELRWRPGNTTNALDWDWYAGNTRLPMRTEHDHEGPVQVFGLRYRSFVPNTGLHPLLEVQAPLTLQLRQRNGEWVHELQLHEWHPLGIGYDGLPADLAQAQSRRMERLTLRAQTQTTLPEGTPALPAPAGLRPYSLDLRFPLPANLA